MPAPRWLNTQEDQAWRGIRRVDVVILASIRRALLSDAGLSDADYEVLSHLSETPGHRLRAGELAGLLRWSTSRLAHQITRMEQRGLVRRASRDDDGRGSDVSITAKGLDTLTVAAPAHVESVRRHLFDHLSTQQITSLADITATLLAAHETSAGHPGKEGMATRERVGELGPKSESTARIGSSPASPVVARDSHAEPESPEVTAETKLNLSGSMARRATHFPKSVDPG